MLNNASPGLAVCEPFCGFGTSLIPPSSSPSSTG